MYIYNDNHRQVNNQIFISELFACHIYKDFFALKPTLLCDSLCYFYFVRLTDSSYKYY